VEKRPQNESERGSRRHVEEDVANGMFEKRFEERKAALAD